MVYLDDAATALSLRHPDSSHGVDGALHTAPTEPIRINMGTPPGPAAPHCVEPVIPPSLVDFRQRGVAVIVELVPSVDGVAVPAQHVQS